MSSMFFSSVQGDVVPARLRSEVPELGRGSLMVDRVRDTLTSVT
jgi:hypothetical protein